MSRCLFLFISIIILSNSKSAGQIVADTNEAFHISHESQRPVLIVFAGSDWCAPCIRFERKVLSQAEFNNFTTQKVVVYQADFPQRKKLSKLTQQQNEVLAEQYNPKGAFPYFVLIRPDRSLITTLTYDDESAEMFIKKISRHLEDEQAKNIQKAN